MNEELLKYAVENDMIDLSYIQEQIEMNKRKELLEKHPYKIWKGRDGRWYTYIPQNGGRVLRSRKAKEEMEACVVEYWKEETYNPTIRALYEEWISGKLYREEIAITTKNRYDRQYAESMETFGKNRVKAIDAYDIENFLLDAIHSHKMTTKGFSNLRTIVFGIFKLAKKKKLVSFSISEVIADIEIPRKMFRKIRKSDDEQIFMDDELERLSGYFCGRKLDAKDLGILLLFQTGMRPGELTALEWVDVDGLLLHVHRTEIRYEDADGRFVYNVRDFPKTEAGIRDVIVPRNAKWILDELKEGNPDGKYVFEKNGKRIKSCAFDRRLRTICRKVGITEKSLNKIRKTYGTILIDSNVDESLIISQMGHTDISTTKAFYYRNRKSMEQKARVIDAVFENGNLIRF